MKMKLSNKNSLIKKQCATYFKAVHNNDLEEVKKVVCDLKSSDTFAENVNVVNMLTFEKSGDTALHICAEQGYLEMMRYFIEEEGANVELINHDGKTALHGASQFAQFEIVKYLLSKGANVNVVKRADWTPLMLACTKGKNLPVVQALVDAKANLNFVNKDGWTCVHIAAREGDVDVLNHLLNSCEDSQRKKLIERRSRNGRMPIHTAVMHGNLDIVKLLTLNGSLEQLNAEDNCGTTPLMDACRCGLDMVQFLIDERHADPRTTNKNGVGLLHVAAEANQGPIIEFLVRKYGLDVNLRSKLLGFTPLHWASREGNCSAAKTLLQLGPNLDVTDSKGRTALQLAQELKREDLCDLYRQCTKETMLNLTK